MSVFAILPPLSLYVHWPWCERKCPYCDFNSHTARAAISEDDYVNALLRDLERDLPRVRGRTVHSIFIGGGTPSLMSAAAIERLLAGIRARIAVAPDAEVTLEANPGSADAARFKAYRAAGINRLSIGVQSFDSIHLEALGRIHGPAEALHAAEAARLAGFTNFNLDLMHGLPGQSVAEAEADVRTAIALGAPHLSAYQLTVEPNTAFGKNPPTLPDDDTLADIESAVHAQLRGAGFIQYEVSAWARTGHECAHNLNYWRFGDYLGIGAGAHAKITDAGGITRLVRQKHPEAYLRSAGTAAALISQHRVSDDDAMFEFMLNALRLTDGVPVALLGERTGLRAARIGRAMKVARGRGLIENDDAHLRPTAFGRRFLNDLTALFLPNAA
jgi:oxygen-independent coproporphyrinogen-3 oxidase